jgi:hypothetical protein
MSTQSEENEKIEQLEEQNEELRERVTRLESVLTEAAEGDEYEEQGTETEEAEGAYPISRRGALTGLAGAGLLGLGTTGTASANQGSMGETWEGTDPLTLKNTVTGNSFEFALRARATAEKSRAIAGFADNSTGASIGLLGRNQSAQGVGLEGYADSSSGLTKGVRGHADSPDGIGVEGENNATSGQTVGVRGEVNSPNGYGLYTPNDAKIDGNLMVEGTKNFVQAVDTPQGPKQVAYNAVESGKARTEASGISELADGEATVELPDHFGMVTSDDEDLVVQITAYADEAVQPQVVEQSTDHIVVEEFGDEREEYTFAYTVKGVREGFEDQPVIRD